MNERQIKQAIKGNLAALCECLIELKDDLNRVAFGYFRQPDFIDEALSRTTLKAIQSVSTLREPRYFKTWLVRVHINNCLDILRELNRFVPVDEETIESYDPANYEDLYEAIGHLPLEYQTLINLRYFNDYTLEQIAQVTTFSEPTVRRYLEKAMILLRIELGDDADE